MKAHRQIALSILKTNPNRHTASFCKARPYGIYHMGALFRAFLIQLFFNTTIFYNRVGRIKTAGIVTAQYTKYAMIIVLMLAFCKYRTK